MTLRIVWSPGDEGDEDDERDGGSQPVCGRRVAGMTPRRPAW
jgi:hypothetical protein